MKKEREEDPLEKGPSGRSIGCQKRVKRKEIWDKKGSRSLGRSSQRKLVPN